MPESIERLANLRALLLTDVVGSTQVTFTVGDAAMARHWAAHDRAARDLLPVWRGLEIDKTDGLLLQFDCVDDAAAYALAYHRALAALDLPFKARAGLHFGSVSLRANSAADIALGAKPFEVEGLATPVTARVMALALAGQTLMTLDAQRQLSCTTLQLQSHGYWRLKGLPEPVELFEIGDEASPFTPPPDEAKAYRVVRRGEFWQPVREVHNTVPAERDSFVGRHEPLLTLARKFDRGARLVSVLGMGGTGKTRLATRFAWTWLGEFPGGVYFCDLAQSRNADAIHLAIAQGLGLRLDKTDPALQIAQALAGRERCLVILDNFEQVTRHAEATVGCLLNRARLTRFIVTTREVLGIVGEDVLSLAPLPSPDAYALFLQRAESARQGMVFSDADQAAIRQLVTMLDGLPLAIELAAARVRVMSPRTLLARMNERFQLLWSSAGRHDRQATLRAAFDWSWEMLSPAEMAALGQLSVFVGGFTLASAEAALDLTVDADAHWAVDVVGWLVDKSFLRQLADERFDMLECVREYVGEHLRTDGRYAGSGAGAELAAQRRHWRYFAGIDEGAATASRCAESTNLIAACRNAVAHADGAAAVALMTRAWAALRLTGPFRLGAELATAVRSLQGLDAGQLAEVEWVAGSALELLGEGPRASRHFERGLALARAAQHHQGEVRLLLSFATQLTALGRLDESSSHLGRAGALTGELQSRTLQCQVLLALGHLSELRSNYDQACCHYQAALALAIDIGDRRLQGGLLGNIGGLHHEHGRLEEACRHYQQALALAVQVGDRCWEGNARCNLGLALHEQGHNEQARQEFERALAMALEMGHGRLHCTVHLNLGMVREAQPDFTLAEVHYANAVRLAHELGDGCLEGESLGYLGLLRARLGRFDAAREDLAAGDRLLRGTSGEASQAVLLCARCEAELLAGDTVAAQDWWRMALEVARQAPGDGSCELARATARVQTLMQAAVAG